MPVPKAGKNWEESGGEGGGVKQKRLICVSTILPTSINFVSFTIVSICRHDEYQYLDLINRILEYGSIKDDRTGVGTKSIFRRSNEVCSASTSPQDIIIAIF